MPTITFEDKAAARLHDYIQKTEHGYPKYSTEQALEQQSSVDLLELHIYMYINEFDRQGYTYKVVHKEIIRRLGEE